ncbi:MAG: hypothetical protein J6A46_04975, partial [Clostridia bacterium]|nr:hypothetical protein [Clostridia bacterium]
SAKGHKWQESDRVAATCDAAGYVVYTCANGCDQTRQEAIAQLRHVFTETTVEPTCDTYGYVLHACNRCDYSYEDGVIPAIGHAYEKPVWSWTEGYTAAEATFTCANNAEHTFTQTATISVRTVNALCPAGSRTEYVAKIVYNGDAYTDVQAIDGNENDHEYMPIWKSDDDQHWRECICGAKTDLGNHEYGEGIVYSYPTCVKNGKMVYYCVTCGDGMEEEIPATEEHAYKNGVCMFCGKVEAACDHKDAGIKKTVDFAQIGMCGGTIEVTTCDCGEKMFIPMELMESENPFGCRWGRGEQDMGENEDGSQWMSATQNCLDCGVTVSIYATAKPTGACGMFVAYEMNFIMNEKVELSLFLEMTQEYHDSERTVIDMKEAYGACGGKIEAYVCVNCGYIDHFSDMDMYCNVSESEPEQFEDENGLLHQRMTMTCVDCGLSYVQEMWVEEISACESTTYGIMQILKGETVLFEYVMEENYSNHQWEYEYVLLGETCDDGCSFTAYCPNCQETRTGTSYGHGDSEYVTVDMAEYGACEGGIIRGNRCKACGSFEHTEYMSPACKVEQGEPEQFKDENGLVHTIMTMTCPDCGVKYVADMWQETRSACESITYIVYKIYNGEKLACVLKNSQYTSNHEWSEDVYEFNGDSCEDGYTATRTCAKCGETNRWSGSGHRYEDKMTTIDLGELGACGGTIRAQICMLCKQVVHLNEMNPKCNVNEGESSEYVDEMGITHYVMIATCPDCGFVYKQEAWTKTINACERIEYTLMVVSSGENVVFEYERDNRYQEHNWKETYTMNGTTCDEGYRVDAHCETCGQTDTWYSSGHRTEYFEIQVKEYGACAGTIDGYRCEICGIYTTVWGNTCANKYESKQDTYTDEKGNVHTVMQSACEKCGLTYYSDSYEIAQGNCQYRIYNTVSYTIGETTIVEATSTSYNSRHNWQETVTLMKEGGSCEDGVLVVRFCDQCGESYQDEYYHHYVGKESGMDYVDLSQYGACYGSFRQEQCPCGYINDIYFNSCAHNWNSNEYLDEEDRMHYVTVRTCEQCSLRYQTDTYYVEDAATCSRTAYISSVLTVGATPVLSIEKTQKEEWHDYDKEYQIEEGQDCDDGIRVVYTCTRCKDSYESTHYGHESFVVREIDLTEYGATCGGKVEVTACLCGKYNNVNLNTTLCEWDEQDCDNFIEGALQSFHNDEMYWHYYVDSCIYTCAVTEPQCAFKIRYANYALAEGCRAVWYQTWQFGYNEETGEYAFEITLPTGSSGTYHKFTQTNLYEAWENGNTKTDGYRYDCPDCGTYYYSKYSYDENGYQLAWEYSYENKTATERSEYRSRYIVHEYEYGYDNGQIHGTHMIRNYETYTYVSGDSWWVERTYDYSYTPGEPFDGGYIVLSREGRGEEVHHSREERYGYYKGHSYQTYVYAMNREGWWEKYEVTFDFNGNCLATRIYTDSYGARDEMTYENHVSWTTKTLKESTCTQSGQRARTCAICDRQYEIYETIPNDHNWGYVNDHYECMNCGLENANGASGAVVFEDLTYLYGNGENYVVGYWVREEKIWFTYYVSLLLVNAPEDQDNEIFLDIAVFELEEIRGYAISKEQIAAAAEALGYAAGDYLVKFTFVPDGADGSFDYAIVFTDEELPMLSVGQTVNGECMIMDYVDCEENVDITFVPEKSGYWSFRSYACGDTYGQICYQENGEWYVLDSNDDYYGTNFHMNIYLEAGKTYVFRFRWLSNDKAGNIRAEITYGDNESEGEEEMPEEKPEEIPEDAIGDFSGSDDNSFTTGY